MARLQHAPPRGGGFVCECLPAGAGPAMSLDSASMSSRGVVVGAGGVGEEGAVDALGELSFEESEGFGPAVAGVASPLVVVAAADERVVEHRDVPNSAHGHAELVTWAQTAGVERVGIEGSGNYGRPAAQALLAAGTTVVEVPPQMTAAARRGRRSGAKTDHIDALEIARIAARDDDLPAPRCANAPDDLQCLVDYRRELVKDRTAAINRLHASLEKIRCGYHTSTGTLTSPKGLDAASKLLRGDTTTRAEVARDRITHIRRLNRHIDQLGTRIATEVSQRGTSLTDIYGIGALTAAEIITETGDPCRYRTKARFAMANGTAPIEASSCSASEFDAEASCATD